MNISVRLFLVGLVAASFSVSAYAEDAIMVRYLDGYPPIGTSTEWINLRISRSGLPPANIPHTRKDVDKFFEKVSAVLVANEITEDWQLAIPDAPSIEITIDIAGKKQKLVSCHVILERSGKYYVTEQGMKTVPVHERALVMAKQSEAFLRHRSTFEEILTLTLERANARLLP